MLLPVVLLMAQTAFAAHGWTDESNKGYTCVNVLARHKKNKKRFKKGGYAKTNRNYDPTFPETWVTAGGGLGSGSGYTGHAVLPEGDLNTGLVGYNTFAGAKKRCEEICNCSAIEAVYERADGECVGYNYESPDINSKYTGDMRGPTWTDYWRVCNEEGYKSHYKPKNKKTSCFHTIQRDTDLPCDITRERDITRQKTVHCGMSPFGEWGDCSMTCGDGTRQRTRTVQVAPSRGGTPCDPLEETQACNMGACPVPLCTEAQWGQIAGLVQYVGGVAKNRGNEAHILVAMQKCGALIAGMATQTEPIPFAEYCECLSGIPTSMAAQFNCKLSPLDPFPASTGVNLCHANHPLTPIVHEETLGNCWDNHNKGKRCTLHKTKEKCLTYYNKNAGGPGIPMLEQICGWSKNEDKFGGKDGNNCRSKPFILRKDWLPIADFGACNEAVAKDDAIAKGEATHKPTPAPTCGECSEFHGDKKGCKGADPAIYCNVDQCVWNKQKDTCDGIVCDDYTDLGMIKCDKKAKKSGATCYFDVLTNTCQPDLPRVTCLDYNALGRKIKKGCKKVGKKYANCEFDKYSKLCKDNEGPTQCDAVKGDRACNRTANCTFLLGQCVDRPTIIEGRPYAEKLSAGSCSGTDWA